VRQLTKTALETALNLEFTGTWVMRNTGPVAGETENIRNGTRAKTVLTESTGQVQIDVPRDRADTFESPIVKKRLAAADRRR
jgi:putative transposase